MTLRLPAWVAALVAPALALVVGIAIGAIIMLLSGVDPAAAYGSLLKGSLGSATALSRTLANATPLILTGLAFAFAARGGFFNIGADGQFIAGAVTAAWLGTTVALPFPLGPIVVVAGAVVAGALVGAIAGFLKSRFSAHEVVTTIMLNFIVGNIAVWLLLGNLSGNSQVPGSARMLPGNDFPLLIPGLNGVHIGLLVAIAAAVIATVFLWRTPLGLELRVFGHSVKAARYSGAGVTVTALVAMGGAGAFAGLAGAGEVLGTYHSMTVPFVSGLGFLGIGVALIGRNHPLGCIAGGLILGALAAGSQQMQFDLGISPRLADVIVALILLFVTMRHLWKRRTGKQALAQGEAHRAA